MKNRCFALSKRGGGLADMGLVMNYDWLYHFETVCPAWTEALDIYYDEKTMREIWYSEEDLWVILPGESPADEPETKRALLKLVFAPVMPLAIVRTASFMYFAGNALQDEPACPVSRKEDKGPGA